MKDATTTYKTSLLIASLTFGLLWLSLVRFLSPDYTQEIALKAKITQPPSLLTVKPFSGELTWSRYELSGVDGATPSITNKLGQILTTQFGQASDIPVEADYDGDGQLDYATLSSTTEHTSVGDYRIWSIVMSSSSDPSAAQHLRPKTTLQRTFGEDGDIPLAGDFDGDSRADLALYNTRYFGWRIAFSSSDYDIAKTEAPSSNAKTSGGGFRLGWGRIDAIPLTGDFDGDAKTDLALWGAEEIADPSSTSTKLNTSRRPATLETFYLPLPNGKQRAGRKISIGREGDIPLIGDFDCDGRDDFAVYDQEALNWTLRMSKAGTKNIKWGLPNAEPLTGNFDSDGCSDLALYIPHGPYCWQFIPSSLLNKNFEQIAWENSVLTRITWCPVNARPTANVRRSYALSIAAIAN